MRTQLLTLPATQQMLKNNVTLHHIYQSAKGDVLGNITLTPADL